MSLVTKTLLMNLRSFERFDGGARSRWPVMREIKSYWYEVRVKESSHPFGGDSPNHENRHEALRPALGACRR